MTTKALHLVMILLVAGGISLVGCDRDGRKVVEASHDSKGNAEIKIHGEEAQREIDQAGQQVQEGARKVGAALERGAEQLERRVGPAVQEALDDASVTARVKAKLVADPEVNALRIDVDTVDGRVTLNGKVASEDVRAEAEKLARRTDGVRDVVNLIQVAGQEPPASHQGGRR